VVSTVASAAASVFDTQHALDEDGEPPPHDPSALLAGVPAVRSLSATERDTPERLLPYVLVPGIDTHELDLFHVGAMGGDPPLIQGEHAAVCRVCGREMRFLFHPGDVLGLAGDAPVLDAYGCDEHRDDLAVFVDVH
jgi:hypothetical protein